MMHSIFRWVLGLALTAQIPLAWGAEAAGDPLKFDPAKFTVQSVTVGGKAIAYRAYEGILYVAHPVDATYQRLNFYAPVEFFEGKSVGPYTTTTAPIFFPNTVGGYMPGRPAGPGVAGRRNSASAPNAMAVALSRGLVVACAGARGRTLQANGQYTGKAPACIVDLKAAVRYLRYNDSAMPGSAGKIIVNGTSAGGALAALLGGTGSAPDYQPYLQALGAADICELPFAVSCYCPITDLDHADAAYEWLFHGVGYRPGEALPADQAKISDALRQDFPPYVNGLKLKSPDGAALTLDAEGNGPFRDYVKSFVIASAQKAMSEGKDLSGLAFLTIKEGKVTDLDLGAFAAYATRLKAPPAFDALDMSTPENDLFGSATVNRQHFTAWGAVASKDHSVADMEAVKMMNPLAYLGQPGSGHAMHWRIRHGAVDRDTSLAVPVILATRLQNMGADVDFALPWGRGHDGDYDLDELFAWIDQICQ